VLSKERSTLAMCAGVIAEFGLNCGSEGHIQVPRSCASLAAS